jgi:hypothetical protein
VGGRVRGGQEQRHIVLEVAWYVLESFMSWNA